MEKNSDKTVVYYFGLRVELVEKMSVCSLIRFQGSQYIVDTEDLVFIRLLKYVA
ncbi:MAG TPA: hypothetical protein VMW38_22295 [Terriglobia bacterium]|nr:hypothetical protein [Terriglobia bacterium]